MLDLQKRVSEGVYKKTHKIILKTSAGVWWLVLGMLQGGGEAVKESAEESNEDDQLWIMWYLKENQKI